MFPLNKKYFQALIIEIVVLGGIINKNPGNEGIWNLYHSHYCKDNSNQRPDNQGLAVFVFLK